MLEHKQLLPKIPNVIQHCPEQWLTIAYLKNIYKEEELYTEIKNKMIKHFDIVPVEKFKDFMLLYTRNKTKHVINGVRDIRKTNNVFNVNRIKDI
jgi:phosphopantetheine adenylyltransferase